MRGYLAHFKKSSHDFCIRRRRRRGAAHWSLTTTTSPPLFNVLAILHAHTHSFELFKSYLALHSQRTSSVFSNPGTKLLLGYSRRQINLPFRKGHGTTKHQTRQINKGVERIKIWFRMRFHPFLPGVGWIGPSVGTTYYLPRSILSGARGVDFCCADDTVHPSLAPAQDQ